MKFRVPHENPQPTTLELVQRAWPEASRADHHRIVGSGRVRVDGRTIRNPARPIAPDELVTIDDDVATDESFGVPEAAEHARGDGWVAVEKMPGFPGVRTPGDPMDPVCFLADVLGIDRDAFMPVWTMPTNAAGPWLCAETSDDADRLRHDLAGGQLVTWWTALTPVFGLPTGTVETDEVVLSYATARITGGICELQLKPEFTTAEAARDAVGVIARALADQGAAILGDRTHGGYMVEGPMRLRLMSLYDPSGTISHGWTTPAGWWPEHPVAPAVERERPDQKPQGIARLTVSAKTLEVIAAGHPWVLPDAQTGSIDGIEAGSLVRLQSPDERPGPYALVDGAAGIWARVWSEHDDAATDFRGEVELRVDEAFARRTECFRDLDRTDLFRVIHGEADGLPGLFLDRVGPLYRATLVGRCAMQLKDLVYRAVADLEPDAMLIEVAHLGDVRSAGDLPTAHVVHEGARYAKPGARVVGREDGLRYWCEPWEGIDVGFFADQRANRRRAAALAGPGQTWLNLFCHTGAYSVAVAAAGARAVSVDISARYLDWLDENLELNGLDPGLNENVVADARVFVADDERAYDGIIVDPPTAASSDAGFWSVRKGYQALLADCFRRLKPGGHMLVCRNARRKKPTLDELVRAAAADAAREIAAIRPAPPAPDYPRLRGFPEGDSFEAAWYSLKP